MGEGARLWQQELALRWSELETRRDHRGTATQPLGVAVAEGEVLAGIDHRGDHQLLVPVAGDIDLVEDTQTAHIQVTARKLSFDGVINNYVAVTCHRHDLVDLFDDILADVLSELSVTTDRPDLICKQALDRWRELLRRSRERLGESEIRGLFGELVVLERILDAGTQQCVSAWTGPDRDPHDFRLAYGDLEVKTLGVRGTEVEIHGVEQLEPPPGKLLHVILVRLAMSPRGVALPELVERIAPKTGDSNAFAAKLAIAGFRDVDSHHYRDRRFSVGAISAIPVDGDFPRIIASSLTDGRLPDEVTRLTYTLDLSAALAGALAGDRLYEIFGRGA